MEAAARSDNYTLTIRATSLLTRISASALLLGYVFYTGKTVNIVTCPKDCLHMSNFKLLLTFCRCMKCNRGPA
jgi:hypothetical protein